MTMQNIEKEFRRAVNEKIRLSAEGVDRYRVFTPFSFQDGDHLSVVLKKERDGWVLSDEGHTFMHLTYELAEKDLHGGNRQVIIENALATHSVNDRGGELIVGIRDDGFGDALYSFVQALLRISDVTYLSREIVRSTFRQDFMEFFSARYPESCRTFQWHDANRDPEAHYAVDCRINGMAKPLFVFALQNESQVKDATISLLKFEHWGFEFQSLAIFENQEDISRKAVARLSDVVEKQFSHLTGNDERIARHLDTVVAQ
jgi:hypothetical protein